MTSEMTVTRSAPFALVAMLGVIVLSTPAFATTNTPPPPTVAAPEDVTVVPGNGKVTVMWSPVQGAEGYRIYRGVNGVWIATPVGRTTGTSHTSYGLANGTTYSFTVAAYTKDGNGPLSLAVSAMPIAPPQGMTAATGDGRVTIKWQPSAGATSYTIYRKVEGEPEFSELTTGVLTPPFVDPGLTNGTRYSYQLLATTAASYSDFSASVSAIPVPPPPKSGPVVSAVAGNGKVTLTWSEVPGAARYSIYRSTTGAFIGPPIGTTTETTFRNGGLANDTTYFYTVAAHNIGGEGARAAAVSAVPVAPPLAPQNPAAVPVSKQMTLSWSPSDGATTYAIYRSTEHQSTGERAGCDRCRRLALHRRHRRRWRDVLLQDHREQRRRRESTLERSARQARCAGAVDGRRRAGGGRFLRRAASGPPGNVQAPLAVDAEA